MIGWLLLAGLAMGEPPQPSDQAPPVAGFASLDAGADPAFHSPNHEPIFAERRVPVLFQKQSPLCLPTAAAAVALYYDIELDPVALARDVPVTRAGVKWDDIVSALNDRGIKTVHVRADPTALKEILRHGTPVVIGQAKGTRGHSVVVDRYDAERNVYVIMDPANPGIEALPAAVVEARAEPTGYRGFVIAPPG